MSAVLGAACVSEEVMSQTFSKHSHQVIKQVEEGKEPHIGPIRQSVAPYPSEERKKANDEDELKYLPAPLVHAHQSTPKPHTSVVQLCYHERKRRNG